MSTLKYDSLVSALYGATTKIVVTRSDGTIADNLPAPTTKEQFCGAVKGTGRKTANEKQAFGALTHMAYVNAKCEHSVPDNGTVRAYDAQGNLIAGAKWIPDSVTGKRKIHITEIGQVYDALNKSSECWGARVVMVKAIRKG